MDFVSKYATLLNQRDVIELFNLLEKKLGSHKAAADACGLTRKTPYDWYDVKDLKFDTKIKLLKTLIEKLPEETLAYLTSLSVDGASEILMTYLSAMYESAISESETESFTEKLTHFDDLRMKYAGLITGRFDAEVSDAVLQLKHKAKEFHLNWISAPSPMITIDQACVLVPMIIREILTKNDVGNKKISSELNISEELIRSVRFSLQQTLTLPGVIPSNLRRQLEDLNKTITSITDPPSVFSFMPESTSVVTATSSAQEQRMEKCT